MKTTIDLPDDLPHQLKLRALNEGRKFREAVADLLRQGLATSAGQAKTKVKADKTTLKRRAQLTRPSRQASRRAQSEHSHWKGS